MPGSQIINCLSLDQMFLNSVNKLEQEIPNRQVSVFFIELLIGVGGCSEHSKEKQETRDHIGHM